MLHPIKRREFLKLAAVASGVTVVSNSYADSQNSQSIPVRSTTPEGIALVSVAYATVGYSLSASVADEVRKRLSGYPGSFAAARAVTLANELAPNNGLVGAVHVRPPSPASKRNKAKPKGNPPAGGNEALPSDSDIKPLPPPPGTYQN